MVEQLIWHFHWHLDPFLLSIALERVTIERFMLATPFLSSIKSEYSS